LKLMGIFSNVANRTNNLSGNVLLVADNDDVKTSIVLHLEALGAMVYIVEDGLAAVNAVTKGSYDLVLMETKIPIMHGFEAISIIRERGYIYPVVALTENTLTDNREKCLLSGFNDCLIKPVNKTKLYDVLVKYMMLSDTLTNTSTNSAEKKIEPIYSTLLEEDPDFIDLLLKFVNNFKFNLEVINKAIEDEDWEELKSQIHQIKGAGGGYGYQMMTELASQIELHILSENYQGATKLVENLITMYSQIMLGVEELESRNYG